jgi:hypothetical protein
MKKNKFSDERELLIRSAQTATVRATRISNALGLPIKVISGGELIERLPNGTIKKLRKISKVPSKKSGLKKGSVLCLK